MKLQHVRATTAAGPLAGLAAVVLLSGCGSDTPGGGGNVTVTVTPTVTASVPSAS
jgi:hypothetical protein